MRRMSLMFLGFMLALLIGCSHMPNRVAAQYTPKSLQHFYDYQLVRSADQKVITLSELTTELASSEVIFIGELHSHSASHYLQIQLLAMLHQQQPNLILSMEQFERDQQSVLDEYLDNKIGEQTLIAQGKAWPNYASDYRPLVEYAKAHDIPVIAANAPKALVRCIAQKGPEVAGRLPAEQRAYLADDLTRSSPAYQAKFRKFMAGAGAVHGQPPAKAHHGSHGQSKSKTARAHGQTSAKAHGSHGQDHGSQTGKLSNSFYAQLARDNTMAESIAKALDAHPNHRVVAINGAFHSDGQLGTVDALKRLKPTVNFKVLSPYERASDLTELTEAVKQGDYIYTVQAMPKRYVQKQHRDRAVMTMIKKRKVHQCDW